MLQTRFEYKGYILQSVSQNIKLLYTPKSNRASASYALSFDGGKTWNIGRKNITYYKNKSGNFEKTVEICLQLNEVYRDEE